jgi:hypothetical protein
MTFFNYINQNIIRIKQEVKMGLISSSVTRDWEIYCRYSYYKKINTESSLAVIFTGEDFKVSRQWVYTIVKRMEEEV